jgi:hypothetical protein
MPPFNAKDYFRQKAERFKEAEGAYFMASLRVDTSSAESKAMHAARTNLMAALEVLEESIEKEN